MRDQAILPAFVEHLKFKGHTQNEKACAYAIRIHIGGLGSVVVGTDSRECAEAIRLLYPTESISKCSGLKPDILFLEGLPPGQRWNKSNHTLVCSWNGDLGCFVVALRRFLRHWARDGQLVWHAASMSIGGVGVIFCGISGVGKSTLIQRIMAMESEAYITNEDWFVMELDGMEVPPNGEVNLRVKQAGLNEHQLSLAVARDLPSAVGPMAIVPKEALGVRDGWLRPSNLVILTKHAAGGGIGCVFGTPLAHSFLMGPNMTAMGETMFQDECYEPTLSPPKAERIKTLWACSKLTTMLVEPRMSDEMVGRLVSRIKGSK